MYVCLKILVSKWVNHLLNIIGVNSLRLGGLHIKASEPKWVNLILDINGVNSLRLGGLHMQSLYINSINIIFSPKVIGIIEW